MADLYVFGDSIGYGAWDDKGGWVDRLKQHFHAQKLAYPDEPTSEVYNLSVDGDMSSDVAARIKAELSARRKSWSTSADVALVAIGANDACAEGSPENYRTSIQEYVAALHKIHDAITEVGLRSAFLSLDPADETRTNPCSWGPFYCSNARIKELNDALRSFTKAVGAPFINILDEQRSLAAADMSFDGLHPTAAGHEWIYQRIGPEIERLLANS